MALIDQASHIGRGCWTGINTDIRHLIRCDLSTGERMNVISHVISSYVRSPDGAWVAFTTFNWAFNSGNGTPSSAAVVGVYRVRVDGSGLQKLNTRPLSVVAVGATEPIWSDDGAWVQVTVWDGTTGGYHPIRIKADGSGENVRLPIIEQPEQ
jgi:Tol biopolymer transport system component